MARASMAWAMGITMPPPSPWITRKTTRLSMDQAMPESTEPIRNSTCAVSHIRRAPNRSMAQPESGTTRERASRYPVIVHWIVPSDASNSWDSASIDTLTMVPSSSVVTAPRTRTPHSHQSPASI